MNEFYNKKWKGHRLLVEEAKESFMERLKREREEQKADTTTKPTQSVTINIANNVNNVKIFVNKKYHTSSSESSEDEQKDIGFTSTSTNCDKKRKIGNDSHTQAEDELEINKKSVRIVVDNAEAESVLKDIKEKDNKKRCSREAEADKKRLQSIAQMKKGYQQQKSLIKSALANIVSGLI